MLLNIMVRYKWLIHILYHSECFVKRIEKNGGKLIGIRSHGERRRR